MQQKLIRKLTINHSNHEKHFLSMTLVVACLFGAATAQAQKQVTTNNAIVPGEVWNDTDGNPINAHGGGILYHEGTYYWYGEYKR